MPEGSIVTLNNILYLSLRMSAVEEDNNPHSLHTFHCDDKIGPSHDSLVLAFLNRRSVNVD
jgi:hypothetical protein